MKFEWKRLLKFLYKIHTESVLKLTGKFQVLLSLQQQKSLSMKLQILSTFTLLFNLVGVKAHDHDHDQIPLEYVKFPQPIYRGISGEGRLLRPRVP